MPRPRGRAVQADEKRATVERILRAWQACPTLRLGQLIVCALYERGVDIGPQSTALSHIEDETLAMVLELFASARKGGAE